MRCRADAACLFINANFRRPVRICHKQEIAGNNYLYIEEDAHLLRLRCDDLEIYDAIVPQEEMYYFICYSWNRLTYRGAVSSYFPDRNIASEGGPMDVQGSSIGIGNLLGIDFVCQYHHRIYPDPQREKNYLRTLQYYYVGNGTDYGYGKDLPVTKLLTVEDCRLLSKAADGVFFTLMLANPANLRYSISSITSILGGIPVKKLQMIIFFLPLTVCLCACHLLPAPLPTTAPPILETLPSSIPETTMPATTIPEATAPETTVPQPTPPATTAPEHSALYIPGVDIEDVILYFNEVCLDGEIVLSGDPSVIQKWIEPIHYRITGDCTAEDLATLSAFTAWLNTVDGFPGIRETDDPRQINLRIYFCDQQDMLAIMGDSFTDMDGAVTFWYLNDEIYDAAICYRTDLEQHLRNSVILEEIYNGLGPIQDTILRQDSVIWQEFSTPQALTDIDELILRLLYHPSILCGMDAQQCEAVIRQLYY